MALFITGGSAHLKVRNHEAQQKEIARLEAIEKYESNFFPTLKDLYIRPLKTAACEADFILKNGIAARLNLGEKRVNTIGELQEFSQDCGRRILNAIQDRCRFLPVKANYFTKPVIVGKYMDGQPFKISQASARELASATFMKCP